MIAAWSTLSDCVGPHLGLCQLYCLLGAGGEVVGQKCFNSTLLDDLHSGLNVGTFQADHQWLDGRVAAHRLDARHHGLGDVVATGDAAEDVHEDGLHIRVSHDDLECHGHGLHCRGTTDVQEVGGASTQNAQEVHGGHGKPSAVHHARHVAVQFDVVEIILLGLYFNGILLAHISLFMDLLLPVGRVVIEIHLGVTDQDAAIGQRGQGVDLQHGAVALDEDLVQICHQCGCFLRLRSGEAHLCGHLLSRRGVDAVDDVHRGADDGRGICCGDVLNGGATSLAANHQGTSTGTIHEDGEILLVFDGHLLGQ
mmetsp:Transcript_24764/g.53959  ORF Transcript_24764/g.53959 Transcript_24764/m.53959 type:complete len:310 (+) Transcript_24764:74-1003(+)